MKERLKSLLQEMGMSQAEFADYIGVGRPSITHIMTGRDKTSQTVVSKTLLKFPEINPMWLLKGEGEMYRTHAEKTIRSSEPKEELVENEQEPASEMKPETKLTEIQTALFEEELPAPAQPVRDVNVPPVPQPAVEQPLPSVPERITPPTPPTPTTVSAPTPSVEKAEVPLAGKPRKLRKIVFFYDDHSFEEYWPEEW